MITCDDYTINIILFDTLDQNLKVFNLIAWELLKVCKAKQNSGKTIWLGVKAEEGSNDWKVTLLPSLLWIISSLLIKLCPTKVSLNVSRQLMGPASAISTGRTMLLETVPISSQRWHHHFTSVSSLSPWKSPSLYYNPHRHHLSFKTLVVFQTGVGNKGKWGDAICSINSVETFSFSSNCPISLFDFVHKFFRSFFFSTSLLSFVFSNSLFSHFFFCARTC